MVFPPYPFNNDIIVPPNPINNDIIVPPNPINNDIIVPPYRFNNDIIVPPYPFNNDIIVDVLIISVENSHILHRTYTAHSLFRCLTNHTITGGKRPS